MREYNVLWSGKYYQHWEVELHSHSYWQIISVLKGKGVIQIGEEQIYFSERNVFLIHPHQTHAILETIRTNSPR